MVIVSKKPNMLISIIFVVVGIGLIVGGVFFNNSLNKKLKEWTHVTATVTGYTQHQERDSDGYTHTMYSEILEYSANGMVFSGTSNVSSSIRPVKGDRREIAYNPSNPRDFVLATKDNHIPVYILFAVGGVFGAIGAFFLVNSIVEIVKKRKSKLATLPTEEVPQTIYDMEYFDR